MTPEPLRSAARVSRTRLRACRADVRATLVVAALVGCKRHAPVSNDPAPQVEDSAVGDGATDAQDAAKSDANLDGGPLTLKSSNGLFVTLPHASAALDHRHGVSPTIDVMLSESPVARDENCAITAVSGRTLFFSLPVRGPKEWIEGRFLQVSKDVRLRLQTFGSTIDGDVEFDGGSHLDWSKGATTIPTWKGRGRVRAEVCIPKGTTFPKQDSPPALDGPLTASVDGAPTPVGVVLAVPVVDDNDSTKIVGVQLIFHRKKLACADLPTEFDEGFSVHSPRSAPEVLDLGGPQPFVVDRYRQSHGYDGFNILGWVRLDTTPGATGSTLHGAVYAYGDPRTAIGRRTTLVGSFAATVCPPGH